MGYIFQAGFLDSRAPLFMDIMIIILWSLPFFITLSVYFAIKEEYDTHSTLQIVLFLATLVSQLYSLYGMYILGVESYLIDSFLNVNFVLYFYIFTILLTFFAMAIWYRTIKFALDDSDRRALPGLYSDNHKKAAKSTAFFISLTIIFYIITYWMIFIS